MRIHAIEFRHQHTHIVSDPPGTGRERELGREREREKGRVQKRKKAGRGDEARRDKEEGPIRGKNSPGGRSQVRTRILEDQRRIIIIFLSPFPFRPRQPLWYSLCRSARLVAPAHVRNFVYRYVAPAVHTMTGRGRVNGRDVDSETSGDEWIVCRGAFHFK